jgi:hemoglobin
MDPLSNLAATLGEETIRRLVFAFYKLVRGDDLIGPLYPPDDWEGAEQRLADFLVYRFGGSPAYLEKRGHPRLRARHFPFPIGIRERDRWLELMGRAMREVALPAAEGMLIGNFFAQVADSMRNRAEEETGGGPRG